LLQKVHEEIVKLIHLTQNPDAGKTMQAVGPENVEDCLSEPLFEIYPTMTNAQFFPQT